MTVATIEGWASVYGNVDLYGDVVKQGAFRRTLINGGSTRPLLWQHDQAQPIGTMEFEERDFGLWAVGQILLEVQQGRECAALVKMGALRGLSIGYRIIKDSVDARKRILEEIELFETSCVTIPANPQALILRIDNAKIPTKAAEACITRMERQVRKIQSAVGCPIPSAKTDADELRSALADLTRSVQQATRAARAA